MQHTNPYPRRLGSAAFFAALLTLPTMFARAQDLSGDGIVVTGTRTEHAEADAPVPTQVIDREEIEAVATDNVEVLLSQIPDLYVRRNEEFGLGASTVRMQGLDANKTAILIDGRRFRGGGRGPSEDG